MKQVQSETTLDRGVARRETGNLVARRIHQRIDSPSDPRVPRIVPASTWSGADLFVTTWSALWFTFTLPFRLVFWLLAWLGRLTGIILGFLLMVIGMALWAGPLFFIGIPLFVVGLVLTLRSLD
jgi:hypothetical protein